MRCISCTTSVTACPPCEAISEALPARRLTLSALRALVSMAPVMLRACSAVASMASLCCPVTWLRSWLVWSSSEAALTTCAEVWRTRETTSFRRCCMPEMESNSLPNSSPGRTQTWVFNSPPAIWRVTDWARAKAPSIMRSTDHTIQAAISSTKVDKAASVILAMKATRSASAMASAMSCCCHWRSSTIWPTMRSRAGTRSVLSSLKAPGTSPACTMPTACCPRRQNSTSAARIWAAISRPRSVVMLASNSSNSFIFCSRKATMRPTVAAASSGLVTSMAWRASSEMRNISTWMSEMRSICGA